MRTPVFVLIQLVLATLFYLGLRFFGNDYLFFAGYTVLQFIILSTAWNILGGYCGYVNFGSAGFFALGAYASIFLYSVGQQVDDLFPESLARVMNFIFPLPLPILIIFGGAVAGLVGLGMGYLTLRLRGTFFSIATLAMAVVAQTLITNWNFVGGSRGAYIIRPTASPIFTGDYIQYLFAIMLLLSVISVCIARAIHSAFASCPRVTPWSTSLRVCAPRCFRRTMVRRT